MFKVYDKFLCWLMTKSAQSGMGMNTQKIYTQKHMVTPVINEASKYGCSRIEISYIANSPKAVQDIFSPSFLYDASLDVRKFEDILNRTADICYRVPLLNLLHAFQESTRYN